MANYRSDQIKHGKIYGWHVYVIDEGRKGYSKIGSASRVEYRLSCLQSGNPRRLRVVKSWHLDNRESARAVEIAALKLAGDLRLPKSEWLNCDAALASELVEQAINHAGAILRTSIEPRWNEA
jgi:hypothetical protein